MSQDILMEGFLQYLDAEKNASPHTLNNYAKDLLQLFEHQNLLSKVKREGIRQA
jgi:site-specific recombinase XerC